MRYRAGGRWWWWGAGLLMLLVALVILGERSAENFWQLSDEVASTQRQIQHLEAENEELARTVDRLKEDPDLIEQIAREELGMVRPGEKVLRFPRR